MEDAYEQYTGYELPQINIVPIDIDLQQSELNGFGAPAQHNYDKRSGSHTISVWRNLWEPQLHGKYIIFHELTHVYDFYKYVNDDGLKQVGLKSYSEYHASYIEMLVLAGASSINECPSFSMKKNINVIDGQHTVLDYVNSRIGLAEKIVERSDFPRNLETLVQVFGSTFNYWGLKAACKQYALDYDERVFAKPVGVSRFFNKRNVDLFALFDKLMKGQTNDEFAEQIITTMGPVYVGFAQEYGLA